MQNNLKELTNKHLLVTGGAGFIGSNLCAYLLQNNVKVTCLDNLITGKLENIEELMSNANFKFINGDITNLNDCTNACKDIDIILHQAALGSVPRSIENPINTNNINISGFLNILWAAKASNIKRVVYAASSSTYGDSKKLPKIEDEIGLPLSPYAVTKYVNELYAGVFSSLYNLELIGLRYFNVFGRKQDPNGAYAAAIPKFIKAFVNYESPIIHGDGSQSRDFTYIDNVIQANVLAATTTNSNAINQVYNVACGEQSILLDLLKHIQNLLKQFDEKIDQVKISFGPERIGDIKHSLASIEKAKKQLNYSPSHNVNEGIEAAIQWYWDYFKNN
ncbi:MAG: LPS biosynthesis protein WbpP [Crocinitomicaceae bacterium]|nr:LPS biosynthesis protein WbpP [Crocinitomicaceae bacterium]MEC9158918.1 NAD-dependent epimerase/dehydratase family protein [Bacteroidota bacterium]